MAKIKTNNPDLTVCPWDLATYEGRWKYYSWITKPTLSFNSSATINEAKKRHLCYMSGKIPKGATESQLYFSKQLFENVHHPDTAQRQNWLGRMSSVSFGKAFLTPLPLVMKSSQSLTFGYGLTQAYDALVNFTHRNGDTKLSATQAALSCIAATGLSTYAASRIHRYLTCMCHPYAYRFAPLAALLAGTIINVPIMRNNEIINGIGLYNCRKEKVGCSRLAAVKGIGETIVSRIAMCTPGIILMPYLSDLLDNHSCWYRKNTWARYPFKGAGIGLLLVGLLPAALAIFPQLSSIETKSLKRYEEEAYRQIECKCPKVPKKLYFNKGL